MSENDVPDIETDFEDDDCEEMNALLADVDDAPNDVADPHEVITQCIPADILEKFEVYSYRNAALILSQSRKEEFDEILTALRAFGITTDMIRRAGGNESKIPKLFSALLRDRGTDSTWKNYEFPLKQVGSTHKNRSIMQCC